MIIHVSGAPGSGKTTLGYKIKHNNKNILVKDLDQVFLKFSKGKRIQKYDKTKYQNYLDKILKKYISNNNKIIVLVGLNKDMGHSDTFYNVYADYKYYIKIPLNKHVKQLFLRDFDGWVSWMKNRDYNILFNQLKKNEKSVIEDLVAILSKNLSLSDMKKDIKLIDKIYKSKKYKFMTFEKIYKEIINHTKKLKKNS